jgi:hypothetical protein
MMYEIRAALTAALWFFSAVALAALFISAAAQGELTSAHMVLAFTFIVLAVAGTLFVLRGSGSEAQQEKKKRIQSMLHNMSDEELLELKQRLSEVAFSEEAVGDSLGDDGEITLRR